MVSTRNQLKRKASEAAGLDTRPPKQVKEAPKQVPKAAIQKTRAKKRSITGPRSAPNNPQLRKPQHNVHAEGRSKEDTRDAAIPRNSNKKQSTSAPTDTNRMVTLGPGAPNWSSTLQNNISTAFVELGSILETHITALQNSFNDALERTHCNQCTCPAARNNREKADVPLNGPSQSSGEADEDDNERHGSDQDVIRRSDENGTHEVKDGSMDYPQLDAEGLMQKDPCALVKPLLRYWQFHHCIEPTEWLTVNNHAWIDYETAMCAISSVTEAISRSGGEQFGLWTYSAFTNWSLRRAAMNRGEEPPSEVTNDLVRVMRNEPLHRLVIPLWMTPEDEDNGLVVRLFDNYDQEKADGHTVLLELHRQNGESHATIYDSRKPWYVKDGHEEAFLEAINRLALDIEWGRIPSAGYLHVVRAARQLKGQGTSNACTLHAILNGWSRALGLFPEQEFQATPIFYQEALNVVNLVLAGHMDSSCLCAWLLCQGFAVHDSSPRSDPSCQNSFKRTIAVDRNYGPFDDLRMDLTDGRPFHNCERRPSQDSFSSTMSDEQAESNEALKHLQLLARQSRKLSAIDLPIFNSAVEQCDMLGRMKRRARVSRHQTRKQAICKWNTGAAFLDHSKEQDPPPEPQLSP